MVNYYSFIKYKKHRYWKQISYIASLETKATLDTMAVQVESKIPGVTNLATKTVHNAKTTEIENKRTNTTDFITTPEFNILTEITFDSKLKNQIKLLEVNFK